MSRRLITFLSFTAAVALLVAVPGLAFGEAAADTGAAKGATLSLWGMVTKAGAPEYLLIAYSFVAFSVGLQGFMTIRREAIIPTGLAEDLHNILSKDGATEEAVENARAMVDNDPSMTGKVISSALAVHDLGHDAMVEAAEDTAITESGKWMTKPGWCSLFANQATLLGLFGTVWGIIEAFMDMAAHPGGVDIVMLSSTIGVSLITTANGMIIAVPMLAFAFSQRTKLTGLFRESNDSVKEILNYFRAPVK
jgi:biopolymer transport protein ExbB